MAGPDGLYHVKGVNPDDGRDYTGTVKIVRKGEVWLGTNAFFFEEGKDAHYASARYGEFRVHPTSGEAVLVGLRGAALEPL